FEILYPRIQRKVVDVALGKAVTSSVVAHDAMPLRQVSHPVAPDRAAPLEIKVIEAVCDTNDGMSAADRGVCETNLVGGDAEANLGGGDAEANLLAQQQLGIAIARASVHRPLRNLLNRSDEPIPCTRNGFDEGHSRRLRTERLAQGGDVSIEVVFLDPGLGPDG